MTFKQISDKDKIAMLEKQLASLQEKETDKNRITELTSRINAIKYSKTNEVVKTVGGAVKGLFEGFAKMGDEIGKSMTESQKKEKRTTKKRKRKQSKTEDYLVDEPNWGVQ